MRSLATSIFLATTILFIGCTSPSTCTDGTKGGDETDIDCGGSCHACAAGKMCLVAADCQSGLCVNNLCVGTSLPDGGTFPDLASPADLSAGCTNNQQCTSLAHATGMCGPNNLCVVVQCDAGYADCDTQGGNGCEVFLAIDANNCGACGKACGNVQNGSAVCKAGVCTLGPCNNGFANCDGLFASGCPAAISKDIANCGMCAHACAAANGTPACTNGLCAIASCNMGFADCNGMASDGCEATIGSDASNCGGCMKACMTPPNSQAACTNGVCSVGMCKFGYADCDKNPGNGCEVNVASDLANCGQCAVKCAVPANASAGCNSGVCGIGMCNALYGDCDKNPANGCEKQLGSDLANCGACGNACNFQNATGACLNGQCGITSCNQNFADCDKNPGNGCEASLKSDPKNCGKCGTICPMNLPACANGTCTAMCAIAFAPKVDYPTGGPEAFLLAIGDLNGDGKLDLAVTAGTKVVVLLNSGNGTFAAAVSYLAGNVPWDVAIGDVNSDGKPDLAVSNIQDNTVSILLNSGNGTFAGHVDYAVGANPRGVALGDLNGDGKPDLAVANIVSSNVSVLINTGNGTFAPAVNYATGMSAFAVALGDLNGDGSADLAIANQSSNNVSVLLNKGNGTFAAAVNYPTGDYPLGVALGDLNGDGKADLVVANHSDSNVSVLLNNGNGTFAAGLIYAAGNTPIAVALGDLNGDGKPDLAVANANGSVSVLVNAGNGAFAAPFAYATGAGTNGVALGDLNGDGKLDIATANFQSATVSILLNQCM